MRFTAPAMMWAAEWRMTSSPSAVSSLIRRTVHSGGSGRWKSMTSPLTFAATTTLARPLEMDSATWRALVPSGYSLTDPSGRVTFTAIGEGNPTALLWVSQGRLGANRTGLVSSTGAPDSRSTSTRNVPGSLIAHSVMHNVFDGEFTLVTRDSPGPT